LFINVSTFECLEITVRNSTRFFVKWTQDRIYQIALFITVTDSSALRIKVRTTNISSLVCITVKCCLIPLWKNTKVFEKSVIIIILGPTKNEVIGNSKLCMKKILVIYTGYIVQLLTFLTLPIAFFLRTFRRLASVSVLR
jgi:hypothetical protein